MLSNTLYAQEMCCAMETTENYFKLPPKDVSYLCMTSNIKLHVV